MLKRLEHPNIIFLQEIIDDNKKDNIFLVTEYHSNGSITDLVEKKNKGNLGQKKGLKEQEGRLYFIDMLKALYYCHNIIKVIHRDIKPDNIMINHNNEAVLIDFGVSSLLDNQEDDILKNNMGS